ncbi:MAG: hypothetical protein GTO02_14115, partial [Candidatus Dadabacteria bacterium]|nr:hypothetical protein [Candidatus Dadabacteria bacterium]
MRARNSLKSFETVAKEITNAFPKMIANKSFPTAKMLENYGLSSISYAIRKYHGGSCQFAECLGCYIPGIFKATDGHFVSSANEYELDEFLYSRGIQHEYNKQIHPDYRYRYDFKVLVANKFHYMEIWGFDDNSDSKIYKTYKERRHRKENIYSDLKLSLISIEKAIFKKSPKELECYFSELFKNLGHDGNKKAIDYDITSSPRLYNRNHTKNHLA